MVVNIDSENGEVRAERTIRRSGNSTVVVIPPEILDVAGFDIKDDVELVATFEDGEIVLRPVSDDRAEAPAK